MKHIALFSLLLLVLGCNQPDRNCNDFKTGTFKFNYMVDGEEQVGHFIRTEDLQIETYGTRIDSSMVRWVNDCEVIFKTINPKSMAEQKDVHIKIITTTANSYTFEYSYVGEVAKQKGEATKTD
ncbi:DNA topoisomerase IV [Bizionia gelidisalsuginis]|uniref:DNA topoisomerase IV n=1 Tax=Bizionia gelidisalsuginis TaxID=291188 RepID=A0ABY3M9R0_9FLAO|nr:DNA topoisomerase IV [Bizionia gelidisalsuginis]TYC11984.1 DNA topoisomerase IV [Bizionia gelidisalsuginis]